ncbi:unnamed protein product [Gadus morhua 'NCC']
MGLGLLLNILMFNFMEFAKSNGENDVDHQLTDNLVVTRPCQAACVTCSTNNGCLLCKPRLFLYIQLDGMRQRGLCLSSCPRTYYGVRSPPTHTCLRCLEDCDHCFSRHFCTRCRSGLFLFHGRCENSCPDGLTPNNVLRECTTGATST